MIFYVLYSFFCPAIYMLLNMNELYMFKGELDQNWKLSMFEPYLKIITTVLINNIIILKHTVRKMVK